MALAYTTGMTFASAADSATNWAMVRITTGGSPPVFGGLDTTVKIEGSGSISMKNASSNNDVAILLDWYANKNTGISTYLLGCGPTEKILYIW